MPDQFADFSPELLAQKARIEGIIADLRKENDRHKQQVEILRAHMHEQAEARTEELLDRQLSLVEARAEIERLKRLTSPRGIPRMVAVIKSLFRK